MRKAALIVMLALGLLAPAFAAPMQGRVLQADPQLLQTWWTSLAVRDGIRERDEVRIERDGQKIGEGLVVAVQGDHSSVMLKGAMVPSLQKGDVVVLVKQATAVATAPVAAPKTQTAYKIVGGHSLISFTSTVNSTSQVSASGGFAIPTESFSSGFAVENFSANSNLGLTSPSFTSTNFSVNLGLGTFSVPTTSFSSSLGF